MINNNDHRSCVPENIIAYIYSEMAEAERPAFERHLAECSPCAEEFAAISDARLSVFEWKRDEFNPLETPVFEIPYGRPRRFAEPVAKVGFLAGIFANLRWVVGTVAACAAIAAIAVLGVYYFQSRNAGNEQALQNKTETVVNESTPEIANSVQPSPAKSDVPAPVVAKFKNNPPKRQAIATPVVAKLKRVPSINNLYASNAMLRDTNVKTVKGRHLRLNNFDDNEDDSLRLAELLADADTKNNN